MRLLMATLLAWPVLAAGQSVRPQVATCTACHGRDGISVGPDIPNLAGQKADYIVQQLTAFRDGSRKNELMASIAGQLAVDDLRKLGQYWSSLPASGSASPTAPPHVATQSPMQLPAGFPAGFSEYSREEDADSQTINLRYANAVALAAARAGQPLPDGSVIIVASHAAKRDASGRWQAEGKPRFYSGMEARAGWGDALPEMLRNGHWLYGLWNAQGEARLGNQQPRCLACHKPQAASSYVFTLKDMQRAP